MLIRREVVVNKTWKVVLAIVLLGLVALPAAARHGSHKNTGRDPDAPYATVQLHDVSATVGFSPRGQAQDLVVQAIASAKTQVLVQAYGFSNTAILKALTDAKNRGVDVRVILDKSNDKGKYSGATYMANAGIPVWIIDEQDVITGSFNFTEAAQEHNAENVLFLQSVPELATVYAKDWQWRQGQSRQYQSVN
jgi:phosphatidylserine/phosphatidylglycerophosphate/cardiolipin synthase-like enzyme